MSVEVVTQLSSHILLAYEECNTAWVDNVPEIQNCSSVIETLARKQKQEAKANIPTRNASAYSIE